MFGMTVHVTAILLAVALAVIALAYLLFGWLRKRSWRVMLRGIGFVLMPVGLLVMGLMSQVVDGLRAVEQWAKATPMSTWIMIGLVGAGLGLVLYVIGSFVPPVSGQEGDARRKAIRDRKLAALQGPRPAATPVGSSPAAASLTSPKSTVPAQRIAPASQVKPTPPPVPNALSADDLEIDDILKRHGID